MSMQLVRVLSVLLLVRLAMSVQMPECNVNQTVLDAQEQAQLLAVQDRYNETLAVAARRNHFFCVERTTEPATNGESLDVTFTPFEQANESVWTLFFQLPALAYLDPVRKAALLGIVLDTVNLEGAGQTPITANPPQNLDDFCIGTFEFYELTTFRESVLFHLYRRTGQFQAAPISSQFEANVATAFGNPENNFVVGYPGQPEVIAFNLSAMMLAQDEILLPFRMTQDNADPTTLAVYLGSFGTNWTIADLQASESIDESMFAENPNPVNYGLEAGDYVFAVFGGILLCIVAFLIILGYCIHPFWLA